MKKLSLRFRITLISVSLLLACSLYLTVVLNQAAGNMADTIEAITMEPAMTVGDSAPSETMPLIPVTSSATSQKARNLFVFQSWLYMLLIVVGGGFATWFVTGKALHPLEKLSEEMESRTAENLSKELPVPKGHDEISSLTQSFNNMNRKLNESFSAQKRFAQSAAHELRTPLTVLKAKVDVFQKRPAHTPEEYEKLVELVNRQTERMIDLVQDLLGLTNLDELSCNQIVNLQMLLDEVVHELTPLADERKITIRLNTQNGITIGNPNLLHRAFSNLIENAVKYNTPGGFVLVAAEIENEYVTIRITDNGPGIPNEQKGFIFEPFYRVDKSRSRQMGGAGLGLAIVKAIVDKHGGTITVEDAIDRGSVFTVRLSTK